MDLTENFLPNEKFLKKYEDLTINRKTGYSIAITNLRIFISNADIEPPVNAWQQPQRLSPRVMPSAAARCRSEHRISGLGAPRKIDVVFVD